MTIGLYPVVQRINRPVLLFDAAGLSLFAVTGAQKTLSYGHNGEAALIVCFALRMLSLHYHWNLPLFQKIKPEKITKGKRK